MLFNPVAPALGPLGTDLTEALAPLPDTGEDSRPDYACPHCGNMLYGGRDMSPRYDSHGYWSGFFTCGACGGAIDATGLDALEEKSWEWHDPAEAFDEYD